jgi:hypothetical protein
MNETKKIEIEKQDSLNLRSKAAKRQGEAWLRNRSAYVALLALRGQVQLVDPAAPFRVTEDDLAKAMSVNRQTALKARNALQTLGFIAEGGAPGWWRILREVQSVDLDNLRFCLSSFSILEDFKKVEEVIGVQSVDLGLPTQPLGWVDLIMGDEDDPVGAFVQVNLRILNPGRSPTPMDQEAARKRYSALINGGVMLCELCGLPGRRPERQVITADGEKSRGPVSPISTSSGGLSSTSGVPRRR